MNKTGNKKVIIIVVVLAILAIAGGAFAYAYFYTDIFRTEQELFAKYLQKDIEQISNLLDLDRFSEIQKTLKENKQEETTSIILADSSMPDKTIELTIDSQTDPINSKKYMDMKLMLQDVEPLQIEYMKENDMYSIRFTNAVKQFLTVQNSNLKELSKKIGLDETEIVQIPEKIDFEKISLEDIKFSREEINHEINKYMSLFYNNIEKEKYSKNKNSVITVEGTTVTANAYILTLNEQDIKELKIKLLEELKNDEIILEKLQKAQDKIQEFMNTTEISQESIRDSFAESIQKEIDNISKEEVQESKFKIIVYESNGKVVRIKIEEEFSTITLDTLQENKINLKTTNIDEFNNQTSREIIVTEENENKLNIQFVDIEGEEQQSFEISIEMIQSENNIKMTIISQIGNSKCTFIRNISLVEDINYKVTLNNSNDIILNNLSQERLIYIFNAVGEKINSDYIKPLESTINSILIAIEMYNSSSNSIGNVDLSETETAVFNSKFQAYEGSNVSAAQVNALLMTVITHNKTVPKNETYYVKVSGDVVLETDASKYERVDSGNYYKVQCKYGYDNCINEIVITKVD